MDAAADYTEFTDPVDGTTWLVDIGFAGSNWECIWDRGCKGIEDSPAAEGGLGCCSVGAAFLDEDEAMTVAALAATLDPALFQYAGAAADGVLSDDRSGTRVVDERQSAYQSLRVFEQGTGVERLRRLAVNESLDSFFTSLSPF